MTQNNFVNACDSAKQEISLIVGKTLECSLNFSQRSLSSVFVRDTQCVHASSLVVGATAVCWTMKSYVHACSYFGLRHMWLNNHYASAQHNLVDSFKNTFIFIVFWNGHPLTRAVETVDSNIRLPWLTALMIRSLHNLIRFKSYRVRLKKKLFCMI